MTVREVIELLQACPPEAEMRAAFDVSDHDTAWEIYAVTLVTVVAGGETLVVLKAQ